MTTDSRERQHPALPNIAFQTLAMPVMSFIDRDTRALNFDVSAPYQRGSIWSDEQRRDLIKSLIMNIPIGAIYRARLRDKRIGDVYRIVDGKQRVETIWAFFDGDLKVPADWFDDNRVQPDQVDAQAMIGYHGMSQVGRRVFNMRTVAVLDFVSDYETREVASGTGTNGEDRQFIYVDRTPAQAIAYEAMVYRLINATGSAQTEDTLANAARVERGEW
jgi:hypothetical protein